MLPAEGAGLLRRLEEGLTPGEAADWYQQTYGEGVDIDGFLDDVDELGFLRDPGEAPHLAPPVRWDGLRARCSRRPRRLLAWRRR